MPPKGKNYKRRGSKKPKVSFDRRVMKVVNSGLETKKAVFESGVVSFNSGITTSGASGDVRQLLADISVGANSWQRTGQSIRLMKIVIRGYTMSTKIVEDTTDYSNNARIGVRRLIIANKRRNSWADVTSTDLNGLLETVNGVAQPFTGLTQQYTTPINRENFTVKEDKRYYQDQGINDAGILGTDSYIFPTANSVRYFQKTLKFGTNGKALHYEGSSQPLNFGYFMSLGYVHLNGTVPDAVETQTQMCYTATAYYKDA